MGEADAEIDNGPGEIQDFIFLRELSEVYLLLDHISGRWDKSFLPVNGDGTQNKGDIPPAVLAPVLVDGAAGPPELAQVFATDWIEEICKIRWPPEDSHPQRARQAALLLRAKDKLTAAAKPASGITIAFTLLVTGDDPPFDNYANPDPTLRTMASGPPPSRMSLARTAFPGLVKVANRFSWIIGSIMALLFVFLVITCLLSWDMTSGYALLARLDAIHVQETDNRKALRSAIDQGLAAAKQPDAAAPAAGAKARAPALIGVRDDAGICEAGVELARLCEDNVRIHRDYLVASRGLSDWLYYWRSANSAYVVRNPQWKTSAAKFEMQPVVGATDAQREVMQRALEDEAWARNFVPLLLNCMLPFCYGVLGAGASAVRYLRMKTKESLLSPRDVTLVLSQLVLGATVGACIGLFVVQPGQAPGAAGAVGGLMAPTGLTVSALAFVAGFGVEGVFLALESLVRRLFNMQDASQKG